MDISTNQELASIDQVIQKQSPHTYDLFSTRGKQYFFGKQGILSQSAQAKELGTKFNATIGIATDGKSPLFLQAIGSLFPRVSPAKAFPYCPPAGVPELRQAWLQRLQRLSPSIPPSAFGTHISTPIVTTGITYGISICGSLFFGEEDSLILPEPYWENYQSIFASKGVRSFKHFNIFSPENDFNIRGLDACLQSHFATEQNAKIILNFPHNPSGYSITTKQAMELEQLLISYAERGKNILVLCDDAYYGLFYEQDVYPESLFSLLSRSHQRITVVKLDGVTKEFFAWGLRVGFITFGGKGLTCESIPMLENKCVGVIRADISSCSTLVQNIVVQAMADPAMEEQAAANALILKNRAEEVKKVFAQSDYQDEFIPYPFNSGYFMLVRLKRCNAEKLRNHLLQKYQIGLISIGEQNLRIAFSCVPQESVRELFDTLYKACKDL